MARLSRRSQGPLSKLIAKLNRAHDLAELNGMPVEEAYEFVTEQEKIAARERANSTQNIDASGRRDFLKAFGLGAVSTAALSAPLSATAATGSASDPGRVAIIGGGIAGLSCARKLWRKGFSSKVFEASDRVGGRAFTTVGYFDEAPSVDRGGELVSTEHKALARLCSKLDLNLVDVNGGALPTGEELYYSNGQLVTESVLNDVWSGIRKVFKQTEKAAPWQPFYYDFNDEHVRLDHLNVPDWLDEIGLGATSPVGGIFQADVISEYGIAPENQPALNLLYLLAYNPKSSALPLAGTDERFRIEGGSEALVHALECSLPYGTVELDKALVAIQGAAEGPYTCVFSDGSKYVADQLVLTLPFTKLREVDISPLIWESFVPEKRSAINSMVLGSNAKLHIETNTRPWQQTRTIGDEEVLTNAVSYSDENGYVTTWDTQSDNPSAPGTVYCDFLGGVQGENLKNNQAFTTARKKDVRKFIRQIENVFPGTDAAYTGKALVSKWSAHPWTLGSYVSPSLGDYTSWWGAQRVKEDTNNIYFAGEHCSEESWGFMNGSVETGQKAAKAMMGLI